MPVTQQTLLVVYPWTRYGDPFPDAQRAAKISW